MPESITITDNRSGESIEIPIAHSGVNAADWRKLLPNIWFYDPAFMEMFLKPREFAGMVDGVTGVLAGGAFLRRTLRMRVSLSVFFTVVRINRWVRRRRGLPVESRFKW